MSYTYDSTWGDLLTGYDGKTVTSDTIGNITSDGTWTYTWEHGRQLASISGTLNDPPPSVMPLSDEKNGLYVDSDGETRYYVNGMATYAGLIYWEGYYYYINSSLKAVKNCTYWVTKNNDLLPSTNYDFDAQGRMINAPNSRIDVDVAFSYNSAGLRVGKTVTSGYELSGSRTVREYSYVYNGSQLTGLTIATSVDGTASSTTTMRIAYDAKGPMFIKYKGDTYQYVTNLQGDVIGLTTSGGTVVVEYTYDAWGNILTVTGSMASTLGEANSLRYRGYVYDSETQLYYLQSRYYDPQMGRFISADAYTSTGQGLLGNNMFAYCNNNPASKVDSCGTMSNYACYSDDPLTSFIQSMRGGSGGVGSAVGTLACVYAVSAVSSKSKSEEKAVALTGTSSQEDYTVYFLYAAGGDPDTIVYVGRVKTKNFAARMSYHESRGRLYAGSIDGLNYAACRVIEQGGMMYHHTINRENQLMNQIRGISPNNKNLYTYLSAVFDLVGRDMYPENGLLPMSYWENFAENEFLNLGS